MRHYLALLTTVVLWAAAFPAIRAGLSAYSFGHLVLLRFLIASVLLLVVWLLRGRPLPARRDLPAIIAVGLLAMTVYPAALSFGEQSVAAGTASILVNLSPIFTAILAALFLGETLSLPGWTGIAIAFAGAAMVAGGPTRLALSAGVVAVIVAAVVQATQFVMTKPLLRRYDPVALTIFSVWSGTVADLLFARGFAAAVASAPAAATLAVAFLAVFSTVIATITWSYALARVPAPHAAAFLYLVAPLSIAIAWAWLGERPSALTWVGGAVALAGVGVVRMAARPVPLTARSSPASPPPAPRPPSPVPAPGRR
jgi:drug/metabolite transporter (DMT)-like permease